MNPEDLIKQTPKKTFQAILAVFHYIGGVYFLTIETFKKLFQKPFYPELFIDQIYQSGIKSLSLTTVTALSTGMVMTLQFGLGLERFGGKLYVPKVVGLSVMRELGPVLTCLMLAGRIGSGYAAEIGSMSVTQQIDAIRALGTDPIRKIVIPRLLAMLILCPVLTLLADLIGIFGGMILANLELNIPAAYYFHEAITSLALRDFFVGFGKTFVFGFIISMTGCYYGLTTKGGTQGVGQSTTHSVVTACTLIMFFDFVLTKVFWIFEKNMVN